MFDLLKNVLVELNIHLNNILLFQLIILLLNDFDYHMNTVSRAVQQELKREDSQWIWKNDKKNFIEFLNMLIQNQSLEVIKHEILHDILIHAIYISKLVTSEIAQFAETA